MGRVAVAFTSCLENRRGNLAQEPTVNKLAQMLSECAEKAGSDVVIFCFMPDHLHTIILGRDKDAKPKQAFDRFRIRSGIWLKTFRPDIRWQEEAYDHVVRRGVDWRSQLLYAANNPVREGLVPDARSYPHAGGYRDGKRLSIAELFPV